MSSYTIASEPIKTLKYLVSEWMLADPTWPLHVLLASGKVKVFLSTVQHHDQARKELPNGRIYSTTIHMPSPAIQAIEWPCFVPGRYFHPFAN